MVAVELLQYIAQSKAAGFNQEQIADALRTAGWADNIVAEALSGTAAVSAAPLFAPQTSEQQSGQGSVDELARIQMSWRSPKIAFTLTQTQETLGSRVSLDGLSGITL